MSLRYDRIKENDIVYFKILIGVGILFLLFYFYVRYLERHTIYQPSRTIDNNPGDVGLNYEDIYFDTSDDVKLHGWLIPAENAKLSLIFCHGNGGNISHRLDKILFFNKLGVNQFIFDYRGYGLSQGSPSEEGLYRDIEAAYKFIKSQEFINQNKQKNQKIIVYGASLGGAVAVNLASKQLVDGLILESTFASAVDMAQIFYPFIPSFLINSKFDTIKKISGINIPKLIMHSETDEIIPVSQSIKLFEAASAPKQFLKIKGGHNDAFFVSGTEIEPAIQTFINTLGL